MRSSGQPRWHFAHGGAGAEEALAGRRGFDPARSERQAGRPALAALTVAFEARGAWRDLKNRTLSTLPDELTNTLSFSQVSELSRAGTQVELDDLKPPLQKLDVNDHAGLDEVLTQVHGAATPEEAKRFLKAVNGLDPKVASQVLKDPAAAQKIADLAKKLPLDPTTDHLADGIKNAKSPDDVNKLLGALKGPRGAFDDALWAIGRGGKLTSTPRRTRWAR